MARFGDWKPLAPTWASQQRMTQVDIVSIHTMVGSLAGTDAMFRRNGYGGTFSHFGVGGNGECTQWQDTAYRGAANYNGNWHIVSVECADVGAPFPAWNLNDGNAVPAFTGAQVETLAQLCAAMCRAHNIPCELIPDAKPGRRGIGYHRLGVPGYMVAGAEQWSNVNKKACPGDRRIAQIIADVIPRAQQILNGDDMPLTQADYDNIAAAVVNRQVSGARTVWQVLAGLDSRDPKLNPVSQAVVDRAIADSDTPGGAPVALWQVLRGLHVSSASQAGQIAGLQGALQQLAASPASTVDLDAVFKAAQDGARSVTDNLRIVADTPPTA